MADISKITIESGTYDVKDDICRNDTNFYDEVTYTKNRGYNTDYFLTLIPFEDNEGNQIPVNVVKVDSGETPNSHAINKVTNFTCNATLSLENPVNHNYYDGIVIGNGVILNDYDISSYGTDEVYLTFNEEREYTIYQRNTNSTTMLNNGVKNAFLIFGQCVNNGVINESFPHHINNDADQYIGIKNNKDLVILTCDGRNSHNQGLDFMEASSILISQGCSNVFALDGGGSTSTSYRCMKLNNNIDNNALNDRQIHYVIDVKKPMKIKSTSQLYSNLGKIKQIVANDTQGLLNNKENKHQIQRYLIGEQTITPNGTYGQILTSYNAGTPTSSLIQNNSGVISLNLPEQQASNLPLYIRITGHLCVYNNTSANTSIYVRIFEDDTELQVYRTTASSQDYVTLTLNNTIASVSNVHTYKIMINAGNTDGTITVQNKGEVTIEYVPNDNTFIS